MSMNNLDVTNTLKVTETQNAANTATTENLSWSGSYTMNWYGENNLGQPENWGFGIGPASTGNKKPGPNTELLLEWPDPNLPQYNRTIVLDKTEAEYFGSYDYVAWGAWSAPNDASSKVYTSHWVTVAEMTPEQTPKQGTATYNGQLAGTLWEGNAYHNAYGGISMTADFAAKE